MGSLITPSSLLMLLSPYDVTSWRVEFSGHSYDSLFPASRRGHPRGPEMCCWSLLGEGSNMVPGKKLQFRSQDEPLPDIDGRIPTINGLVNRGFPPPLIAGKGPFCRYFNHGVLMSHPIP